MGRIVVDLRVANNQDVQMARGHALAPEEVRQTVIQGVVDTGANHLILPASIVQQLGLPKAGEAVIRYLDRRSATRDMVDEVRVELLGRHGTFRALVEPERDTTLIGAIILEDLDFLIDCGNQRLYPRDPEHIISEAEALA